MSAPAPAPSQCLIVDDDPRVRRVLVQLMRAGGFRCLEAGDGEEALERLAGEPAALVISDLQMPRMDGAALLRRIRAAYPDTAVMMITASSDVEMAVRCLADGAMDYLTKPFHVDEVRARVAQVLEKRRLVLENREYQERLEEKVQVQASRLEQLFLAGVQSLADALEVKDPYTRGHSVRVSRYAVAIARRMALPADVVRQVELGGHVHDIGKIGVREAVLNKPGRLTREEYDHVMTHPMVGWRILSPLLADAPIALNVVRSHHEFYDGRGIPDGLAGEAIPLEARIAAAADSLDAMTSSRPYRPGRTLEAALEELVRCAGTQFDPRVVEAAREAVLAREIEVLEDLDTGASAGSLLTAER